MYKSPLIVETVRPNEIPPVLVAGRRATAFVQGSELRNVAAAPVEMFSHVALLGFEGVESLAIYPNFVVTRLRHSVIGGVEATVFASAEDTLVAVLFSHADAGDRSSVNSYLELDVTPHLEYISKFSGADRQSWKVQDGCVVVTTALHPELVAGVWAHDRVELLPGAQRNGVFRCRVTFSGRGFIVLAGSANGSSPIRRSSEELLTELTRVDGESAQVIESGVQLDCPDPHLSRFFSLSRIWFHKARRLLPFGSPYSIDSGSNEEVEILAASPDYHGLFANDCVQSSYEGMLVAPQLMETFLRDLDVLFEHRGNCHGYIPEAVEFFLGRQELFIQDLRIGQHPEWIVSAASIALVCGDRNRAQKLASRLQVVSDYFQDTNGDGVGEWDISAYPEQPETTGFRMGMLYAQTWWVWAYDLAGELFEYLGNAKAAAVYRRLRDDAQQALCERFARIDGYGSWMAADGALHPHAGHCMILPVALGYADRSSAKRALDTVTGDRMWLDPYGPLRADRDCNVRGREWVWGFMRWNLVTALFAAGRSSEARALALMWSEQELNEGVPAMESYPRSITGITGRGYVWTAARAIRALTFGLFGIKIKSTRLEFHPNLPPEWDAMVLRELPFRGRTLDVEVRRTGGDGVSVNVGERAIISPPVSRDSPRVVGRSPYEH